MQFLQYLGTNDLIGPIQLGNEGKPFGLGWIVIELLEPFSLWFDWRLSPSGQTQMLPSEMNHQTKICLVFLFIKAIFCIL